MATSPTQIVLFTGGPTTHGPGLVAPVGKAGVLRTHSEIAKGATLYRSARSFYRSLATPRTTFNLFSGSYNQVGAYEMRDLCSQGVVVATETFSSPRVSESFGRWLQAPCIPAVIKVTTSKGLKVRGMMGPGASLKTTSESVHDEPLGLGLTDSWTLGSPHNALAFFLSVEDGVQAAPLWGQFRTTYRHPSGQQRLRITTFSRPTSLMQSLTPSFDPETAITLLARGALSRLDHAVYESPELVRKWVDGMVLGLCKTFAGFTAGVPESFTVEPPYNRFLQLAFHLCRSPVLNLFNSSPDETAVFRHELLRRAVEDSCLLIQPSLTLYSTNEIPVSVMLNHRALALEAVLLLDAYLYLVVWVGSRHSHGPWRDSTVTIPLAAATALASHRWPPPRLVVVTEGSSQARFLTSHLSSPDQSGPPFKQPAFELSLPSFFRQLAFLVVH